LTTPASARDARLVRALDALAGLSVGDAFGELFFGPPGYPQELIATRRLPYSMWRYTDDTAMALSITDELRERGEIDRDALAARFAASWVREPGRGYGGGAQGILRALAAGRPWREAAALPFGPDGSFGNGGAMRAAPLGGYFACDLERLCEQAALSAEVTHLHPEGQAGAIAVALAAAYAWLHAHRPADVRGVDLLEFVARRMPSGVTRDGVQAARALPADTPVPRAAEILGSGSRVSAMDTVPYCLWSARRHLTDYEAALWSTVAGLGDRDTTCAIVGGIVALRVGRHGIPENWLALREGLPGRYVRVEA